MPSPITPQTVTGRPIYRRLWFRLALFFLLLVTAVALSLPLALRYSLRHWLLANGADQVEIGTVRVNPFTASVSLRDVTLVRDNTTVLDRARIDLNLGLAHVLGHQAYIQSIEFRHFNLDLEQDSDGRLRIASYLLPEASEGPSEETDAPGTPWIFRADRVMIHDSRIHLTRPDLELSLAIDQATLVRFTTAPGDKSGAFSFKGRLNNAPLSLELNTIRVLPDLVVQGRIMARELRCDRLDRLLAPWLDPFTGRLTLNGQVGFASLSSGVMTVDYNGSLALADGDIGGQAWKTAARTLTWKGKVRYRDDPEQAMRIITEGTLHGISLRLDLPQQRLALQEPDLELRGRTVVTIAGTVRVQSDASLTGRGSLLELPPHRFSDKGFRWQGTTFYDSGGAAAGQQVHTDGNLTVHEAALAEQTEEAPLAAESSKISWQGRLDYVEEKGIPRLGVEGTLAGKQLSARLGDGLQLEQAALQVSAHGSLHLEEQARLRGTASLAAETFRLFRPAGGKEPLLTLGSLHINDLAAPGGREIGIPLLQADSLGLLVRGDLPLRINVPEIRVEGLHTGDLATLSARLLQVQSPRAEALANGRELVRLGSVELKGLQGDTNGRLEVQRFNFDDLLFLAEKEAGKPVCRIGGATLAGIHWSPGSEIRGDTLGFDDLFCTLIRRRDGSLEAAALLAAMRGKTSAPAAAAAQSVTDAAAPIPLRIGSVIVRGKSGLHFEDHTLAVPFVSDLAIDTLQITDIDSGQPQQPAHIRMSGILEERAPLKVSGTIRPFADPLALALKIKLKNYPLARLSAYTVQSVGTALAAGRLKLKTRLAIADGRLDMENEVVLKKLQTKTISRELAKQLDNRLPVPLDSALSLLRDSQGNITLDVPVKGPLSDLNVGIGDILITALGKAIVPAASSYLVYALGPYAALAYVGMKVGEKMLQVSLPPVRFAPGSAEIDKQQKEYLKRIASLLNNRPETDLQLMPISTPRDLEPGATTPPPRPAPDSEEAKTLLRLGQERAEALRDYLATTWSIDRNRLMISMTRIMAGDKETPRVELQL